MTAMAPWSMITGHAPGEGFRGGGIGDRGQIVHRVSPVAMALPTPARGSHKCGTRQEAAESAKWGMADPRGQTSEGVDPRCRRARQRALRALRGLRVGRPHLGGTDRRTLRRAHARPRSSPQARARSRARSASRSRRTALLDEGDVVIVTDIAVPIQPLMLGNSGSRTRLAARASRRRGDPLLGLHGDRSCWPRLGFSTDRGDDALVDGRLHAERYRLGPARAAEDPRRRRLGRPDRDGGRCDGLGGHGALPRGPPREPGRGRSGSRRSSCSAIIPRVSCPSRARRSRNITTTGCRRHPDLDRRTTTTCRTRSRAWSNGQA
jgi:hypothetical protein